MDKHLLEKGFKEFRPNAFCNDQIETCFQKRYDDDKGKKYFITVNKWKPFTHPYTKETSPPSYEYTAQLYQKGTHNAVDILFHTEWDVDAVEEYLEMLFSTGKFDYYEEFECE